MKRSLILPALFALGLFSCKEKAPNVWGNNNGSWDTTYVTTAETPQPHNVLMEDFTGVSCSNCPQGHDIIEGLVAQYPGRINVLSIYPKDFGQAEPIGGLTPDSMDFRTDAGTDIDKTIYNTISVMPSGGVDRVDYQSSTLLDRSVWGAAVAARLSYSSPVNLTLSSTYDAVNKKATVEAKVSFIQDMTDKVNLSVALTENGLIGAQEDGINVDTFYHFTNVFRTLISNGIPWGDGILSTQSSIPAGTVYIKRITFSVSRSWNPANCNVVAFVNYNGTGSGKDVLQSASCKLAP